VGNLGSSQPSTLLLSTNHVSLRFDITCKKWHKLLNQNYRKHLYIYRISWRVYSIHPKAGRSGFQMVISRTLFVSVFQMVRQSNGRDRTKRSGFQMVGTKTRSKTGHICSYNKKLLV
jgi:hypothetical protein